MKNDLEILRSVRLFEGIEDLTSLLTRLQAMTREYLKGERIFTAGDAAEYVGIVLLGQIQVLKETAEGEQSILAALGPGELFGEALCCALLAEIPVSVRASTNCRVLLLPFASMIHSGGPCGVKLLENMTVILAQKNLNLQRRMEILESRTLREKLTKYLGGCMKKRGEAFTVPLNREEMADFLRADRSALSHELMKMKSEGLIWYRKNTFTIL